MKLISAPWVLPLDSDVILENGAVVLEAEKILAVGRREDLQKQFPDVKSQHFEKSVILPGLVNAHCHLDRAGFFERFTVETDTPLSPTAWLLENLRYLSKTPASVVSGRMERELDHCLSTGMTCLGMMSHYEGTFPLVSATPIRGVIFQEILSGPDKRAQQRFEISLALIDKYIDAKPHQLKIGFGPYAAYCLSKNLLNIISRQAKDSSLLLQMHCAEHFSEMEFFYESKGEIATKLFPAIGWEDLPPAHRKTPIQYLEDIGFFQSPVSLVGGYHLSGDDFGRLAKGKTHMIYCPSGNRRFKFGQFPLKQYLQHQIPLALGTEVFSNPDGFDLWAEMRLALKDGLSPLPNPLALLKMATIGGAQALGFDSEIGTLTPGKKADYLIIKEPALETRESEDLLRELILQTESSAIKRVAINGKIIKGH